MFFDFFSIKIKAESKATDEAFIGYFFGKTNETLEYRFICFPRRYSKQAGLDLNLPLSDFKDSLSAFYQELMAHTAEISDMTGEFMRYLHVQIKKMGGRESVALRLTKIIENEEGEMIRLEILDIFKNWTSTIDMEIIVETSTYEEMTTTFLSGVDSESFLHSLKERHDLMALPEIYPIVDPLDGVSIDTFDIGDTLYCTVIGFTEEFEQQKLISEFPSHFDAENKNTVPLEAIIVSKEILPSVSKNFVMIKVQIGSSFIAKSIVLRSIRLMYDPDKMKKRLTNLKNEADDESLSLAEVMSKYRSAQNSTVKKLEEKRSSNFGDFFLSMILLFMIAGLIIIIIYFFLLS
ncbi:MAG TPA: DUF4899 domain-containing protein [Thermotogota bacterium]|nr:DUF4899 domain-containing protein [Thermotogota bacterium]HPJ88555.1 DUF4899 domain-containing protein [Thermotogota bacterium]HPR96706.1 DUF4899 domain-containing protein [Thermotogota bacterium]